MGCSSTTDRIALGTYSVGACWVIAWTQSAVQFLPSELYFYSYAGLNQFFQMTGNGDGIGLWQCHYKITCTKLVVCMKSFHLFYTTMIAKMNTKDDIKNALFGNFWRIEYFYIKTVDDATFKKSVNGKSISITSCNKNKKEMAKKPTIDKKTTTFNAISVYLLEDTFFNRRRSWNSKNINRQTLAKTIESDFHLQFTTAFNADRHNRYLCF